MLRRLLLGIALVGALTLAAFVGAIFATGWTDTRTSSGNVAASTTPDLLDIRDGTGAGNCSGDDSGADEVIFDNPTQLPLLPDGPPAEATVCLVNVSVSPWEITDIVPTFTKTFDPGGTCVASPVVALEIWNDGSSAADDPWLGIQPQFLPAIHELFTPNWRTIHVGPTGYEGIRIHASLPSSLPAECQGVTWSLSIAWTATII